MSLYQAIKNFILALYVCKKYRLQYKPFCSLHHGEYNYIHRFIKVNPFNPNFESVLFHEVGHHVHHKLVNYDMFFDLNPVAIKSVTYNNNKDFHKLLEAESFASRFAMKTRRADKAMLVWAFNTYTRLPFALSHALPSQPHFSRYIDAVAKYTRRITNF